MMRMTARQLRSYYTRIRKLRAEEEWRMVRAASAPHMSDEARADLVQSLNEDMGRDSSRVITGEGVETFIRQLSGQGPPKK